MNDENPVPPAAASQQTVYKAQLMPQKDELSENTKKWIVKITIAVIALIVFQIPLYLIKDLNDERHKTLLTVQNEIAGKWGNAQIISIDQQAENFTADANLQTEIRYRGIYQVAVFTANTTITADFDLPQAKICRTNISDMDGLQDAKLTINGTPAELKKGENCLLFQLPAGKSKCELTMKLRGSGDFQILPAGKENRITVSGNWASPAFTGDPLPESRTINAKGFSATWNIGTFGVEKANPGVSLVLSAGTYQQMARTISYATFFLIIFFFTLLAGELITKINIHPLQYLVSAGAPVLFYLMVLAFSEHLGFPAGFLISAAVIVFMVSAYARMFLNKLLPALIMGAVFAASYLLNYQLLRMEDFALLTGTIVLAVILGVLMLLTGKINLPENSGKN